MPIKGVKVEAGKRSNWTGRKRNNCTGAENREVNPGFRSGVYSLNPWKVHSQLQAEEGNELEDGTFY